VHEYIYEYIVTVSLSQFINEWSFLRYSLQLSVKCFKCFTSRSFCYVSIPTFGVEL